MFRESPSGVRGADGPETTKLRNYETTKLRIYETTNLRNYEIPHPPDPPKGVYNALSKKYKNWFLSCVHSFISIFPCGINPAYLA